MDYHWTVLLTFALWYLPAATSVTWTSSSTLADGQDVRSCQGHDLHLLWGYELEPRETLVDAEWYFASPHSGQENLLAFKVGDTFKVAPSAPVVVREANSSVWSGGIIIPHVTPHHSGRCTIKVITAIHGSSLISIGERQTVMVDILAPPLVGPAGFHTTIVADSVRETPSGDLHVQLACGSLTYLGHPPVSVMWKTPHNTTVNSTSQHNGTFYLDIDSHPDGVYSCFVPPDSPALQCVDVNSPLRTSQHIRVYEANLLALLGIVG